MNSFGVIVIVFVGIMVLLTVIRLGISITSTRRMSGQGQWSADGAEMGGFEARGIDRHHNVGGHHNIGGHHNVGHHNVGGGGHIGGGHIGGGHHG